MSPDWIAALAAAVSALGVAKWGPAVFRFARKASHFLDDVAGSPPRPGVPERPGLMARVAALEAVVAEVRAETRPNGGSSMRDVLHRTAADVSDVKDDLAKLAGRVELFEHQREDRDS